MEQGRNQNNKMNGTYKTYKTYVSYCLLVLIVAILVPLLPQRASAAVIAKQPNNLGLAAYWTMNEGTGTLAHDSSGNGNDVTLNSATWASGTHGNAASLSGSGYLGRANTPSLNISGGLLTISAWFKANTVSGTQMILTKGAYGSHWNYGMGLNGTGIVSRYNNGDLVSTAVAVNANVWHHVVEVYTATSTMFYYDGNFIEAKANNSWSAQTGGQVMTIGAAYSNGTSSYSEFFNGVIDDVRIYSRQLSTSEVATMYRSGQVVRKNVSNQNLVGYWPMNEGRGSIAHDFSGGGNNGTLAGATLPSWVNGKRAGALNFDGSTSRVNLGSVTTPVNVTISAWIKTSSAAQRPIFSNRGSGAYYGITGGKFFIYYNSATPAGISSNRAVNDNQWHLVTWTNDGSTSILYIDGLQDSAPAQTRGSQSGTAYIGWDSANNEYFPGSIDDLRIYSRVLSPSEVQKLYSMGETTLNANQNNRLTSGLLGYWTFNGADISGTTVYDRSGLGNNGTMNGPVTAIGKVGQGLKFNGVSDYVTINYANPINSTSVVAWFKRLGTPAGGYHIVTGGPNVEISINEAGGYIRTGVVTDTLGRQVFNSGSGLVDGRWHQVAMTYNGSALNSFIDGVQTATNPVSGNLSGTAGEIGRYLSNAYVANGVIDEVRIYNRALSSDEVKQLYNMGK